MQIKGSVPNSVIKRLKLAKANLKVVCSIHTSRKYFLKTTSQAKNAHIDPTHQDHILFNYDLYQDVHLVKRYNLIPNRTIVHATDSL